MLTIFAIALIVQFCLRSEASYFWYRIASSNALTSLCIIGAFGYHETLSICVLYACSLYVFLSIKLPGKEADGMRTILLGSMFISLVRSYSAVQHLNYSSLRPGFLNTVHLSIPLHLVYTTGQIGRRLGSRLGAGT